MPDKDVMLVRAFGATDETDVVAGRVGHVRTRGWKDEGPLVAYERCHVLCIWLPVPTMSSTKTMILSSATYCVQGGGWIGNVGVG